MATSSAAQIPMSDDKSSEYCKLVLEKLNVGGQPIVNSITMKDLGIVAAAVFAGVTTLLAFILIHSHVMYYSNRNEQRQIIRMNVIPPLYAIFALVCAIVGETAEYIVPIPKVFESVALCCLFLLMLEFAVPNSLVDPGLTFTILRDECVAKKQGKSWYTPFWIMVFQYPFLTLGTTIATEVVSAKLCPTSSKYEKAGSILRAVDAISVVTAIVAIAIFHRRMHDRIQPHPALRQLLSFKTMVGLVTLVLFLFSVLTKYLSEHTSPEVTFLDWTVSVPAVIIAGLMVLYQMLFIWAFSVQPYKRQWQAGVATHGMLNKGLGGRMFQATIDVINPSDIIRGMFLIFGANKAPMKAEVTMEHGKVSV